MFGINLRIACIRSFYAEVSFDESVDKLESIDEFGMWLVVDLKRLQSSVLAKTCILNVNGNIVMHLSHLTQCHYWLEHN